ncbi:MAG: phosphate ABC transporter permease family protein, partial [Desulfamplus sp.]|nr:phosphate ABC transporter permease family protein [Desulfamplus sp.]
MNPTMLLLTILFLSVMGFIMGKRRSYAVANDAGGISGLHSRPTYYGSLTALWCAIPALIIFSFWLLFESSIITDLVISSLPDQLQNLPADRLNLIVTDIKNIVNGNIVSADPNPSLVAAAEHYKKLNSLSHASLTVIVITIAIASILVIQRTINPKLRARNHVERVVKYILIACSTIAIFTTIGIVLSVLYEAIRFFKIIPLSGFLTGLEWSPQMAIRADQVGSSGSFGAVPVFVGTMLISAIAMCVAVPIGLMSAIYLSEYANRTFRSIAKPLLEILAGIPTVVYGFFAA